MNRFETLGYFKTSHKSKISYFQKKLHELYPDLDAKIMDELSFLSSLPINYKDSLRKKSLLPVLTQQISTSVSATRTSLAQGIRRNRPS